MEKLEVNESPEEQGENAEDLIEIEKETENLSAKPQGLLRNNEEMKLGKFHGIYRMESINKSSPKNHKLKDLTTLEQYSDDNSRLASPINNKQSKTL